MEKLAQNIQEAFLNNARKERTFLTIYLMSGVKLSGRIRSFDKYSVVLESNNQEQLIFKHAISTVVMARSTHSDTRESRENREGREHRGEHASAPKPGPASVGEARQAPTSAPVAASAPTGTEA